MKIESELIDVAAFVAQGTPVPANKKYLVSINGDPYIFDFLEPTGREILSKIGISDPHGYVIYQIINDEDIEIVSLDDTVNLATPGFERFVIKESTVFDYFVDNDPETSSKKILTPSEILERAAYRPSDYYLVELHDGGQQTSYIDRPMEPIELTHKPKKRFISIYKGNMPVS